MSILVHRGRQSMFVQQDNDYASEVHAHFENKIISHLADNSH